MYLDSLGIPTGGIGHKILPCDNLKVGDAISDALIDQWFSDDLSHAITHCEIIFPDLMSYPEAIQECLVNMTFNLGANGLAGKFPKFCAAIKAKDWQEAVHQLQGTLWQKQVGARADRIIAALQFCADTAVA